MNINPQILFFVFFAVAAGYMLFRTIKRGGFKAAMFDAPIESTVGEVNVRRSNLIDVAVKIHKLGGDDSAKAIGLELVAKSFASYQMTPVSLSVSEAKDLIKLLETAVAGK